MSAASSSLLRRVVAFSLLASLLLLSGCVYLRLLALKKQLADFDRNFAVETTDGFKLTLKNPVLLDEDLAFFKLAPESRERLGLAERWHFRWQKDYKVAGESPERYELTADFTFVEHKLQRVAMPERLFAFLPKPLLLSMIRAFGHAEVDKANRSASAQVNEPGKNTTPMQLSELTGLLGAPETSRDEGDVRLLRYRYRGVAPEQKSGVIDVTFTVDPKSNIVQRIDGLLFNAKLKIDLVPPAAKPPA